MIDWGRFGNFFRTGIPSGVLYLSLLVMVAVIVAGCFSKAVKDKKRFTVWTILIEYMFVVACSTVVCRNVQTFEFDRLELEPFWTYKTVLAHAYGVSVWDIVLNVILFIPLGFLVKLLYPSLSVLRMVVVAVVCSLCIEINQYVFEKGVAQTDDLMHNTIGSLLGWALAKITWILGNRQS